MYLKTLSLNPFYIMETILMGGIPYNTGLPTSAS